MLSLQKTFLHGAKNEKMLGMKFNSVVTNAE
jgi:hypothetical protein